MKEERHQKRQIMHANNDDPAQQEKVKKYLIFSIFKKSRFYS